MSNLDNQIVGNEREAVGAASLAGENGNLFDKTYTNIIHPNENLVKPQLSPNELPAIEELAQLDQWVCWRYSQRNGGKPTKVPYQPTGYPAKSDDPDTWFSYFHAKANAHKFEGIGFVISENDPYVGVDLDNCIDDQGKVADWAQAIVQKLDSYTEITPSEHGLRIFVRGEIPQAVKNSEAGVEIYSSGRFLTITGNHLEGTPTTIEDRPEEIKAVWEEYKTSSHSEGGADLPKYVWPNNLSDDELIAKAKATQNGDMFTALWEGDTSAHGSHSEADQALCNHLAFWAGGEEERIDRLFRESGLMRDKWDERRGKRTYGEMTIEKSLAGRVDFFIPPGAKCIDRETGEEKQATRFSLISTNDLMTKTPDVEWVLSDVLPTKSIVCLAGDFGQGKSWIALDLAVAVATGKPWMKRKTKQGAVVIIDEENGPPLQKGRVGLISKGYSLDSSRLPIYWLMGNLINLTPPKDGLPDDYNALLDSIRGLDVSLIIFDSFARIHRGDENSASDVAPVMGVLRKLANDTGACVVYLHHQSKATAYKDGSGKKIRGSIDIVAASDAAFEVSKNLSQITVTQVKERWNSIKHEFTIEMESEPNEWVRFKLVNYEDKNQEGRKQTKKDQAHYAVLKWLRDNGPTTAGDLDAYISQLLSCSERTVRDNRTWLDNKGLIRREGNKQPYEITENGLEIVSDYDNGKLPLATLGLKPQD